MGQNRWRLGRTVIQQFHAFKTSKGLLKEVWFGSRPNVSGLGIYHP